MAVNDLFSFLEEDPTHEQDNDDVPEVMDVDTPVSPNRAATPETKKRKVERSNGHTSSSIENEGEEGSTTKKRRVEPSSQPVVVDEFETEAKREVTASAGLTESADAVGSRLELKHQVRNVLFVFFLFALATRLRTVHLVPMHLPSSNEFMILCASLLPFTGPTSGRRSSRI